MLLFKKGITKGLIKLRGCAGWSVPVLFANPRRQFFSRRGPYDFISFCQSPRISHHHSVLDADSDDGHGSQSFQSPTLPASKPPVTTAGSQGESEEESSEEGDNSEEDSDQGEEVSDDEDDEFEDIEEENEDEEQQTTQIEVNSDQAPRFYLFV